MNKTGSTLLSFLLLTFSTLTFSGCGSSQEKSQSAEIPVGSVPGNNANLITLSPATAAALDLAYDRAQYRVVDFAVKTTGEVLANANLTTHVTAPVTGRVTEVRASVGDRVVCGQVLLMVRSQDIEQSESDLLQSEGQVRADLKRDLLQINSDLQQGQAQLTLSQSTYQRVKGLLEEKIASRADYEAAKTQYEKDRITVETTITKKQATIALSQERMKLLTEPIKQKLRLLGVSDQDIAKCLNTRQIDPIAPIVSPETGIVTERTVNLGELVDPSKPLFTIADFHNVWLKADVYEKDVSKVQPNQPIELELESFPGEIFRGRLNYVADSINPDSRTLSVRAEVENPGLKLKPKMFAKMRILVGERRVLTVPKTAIQETDVEKVVYVPITANTFKEQKVELGGESGDYNEVMSGLKEGERVVTKGSFELRSESLKESS